MPSRRRLPRRAVLASVLALLLAACGGGDGSGGPPGGTAPATRVLTIAATGPAASGSIRAGSASCGVGASCPSEHAAGSRVTITAEPGARFMVASWGGACAGTSGTTCTVTMTEALSASVEFRSSDIAITVAASGTGAGRITSTPAGIDCSVAAGVATGSCTLTVEAGTTVTLLATAAPGSTASGWSGGCVAAGGGSTAPVACTPTLRPGEPLAASAGFATAALQSLAVALTGTTGRVTSTPAGIDCTVSFDVAAGSCSAAFPAGTEVRLTQLPVTASTFTGWSGGCAGTATTCTIVAGAAPGVGARWLRGTTGELRLSLNGDGVGRVTSEPAGMDCEQLDDGRERGTCEANFRPGTPVRLVATPTAGSWSEARAWGNACTGTSCVVTSGAGSQLAVGGFDRSHFPVTITLAEGADAALRLTAPRVPGWTCEIGARPDGSPVGTTCTVMHPRGGGGSIDATSVPGLPVAGWRRFAGCGDPCGLGQHTGSRALVLAIFRTTPALVTTGRTIGSTGGGRVTLTTEGSVTSTSECVLGDDNTVGGVCFAARVAPMTVTLSATAASGATFEGWSRAACGTATTCTVTLPAPGVTNVSALFMRR